MITCLYCRSRYRRHRFESDLLGRLSAAALADDDDEAADDCVTDSVSQTGEHKRRPTGDALASGAGTSSCLKNSAARGGGVLIRCHYCCPALDTD